MFCEKCGRKNPDGAAFCEACGAKMVNPDVAPQANNDGAQQTVIMTPFDAPAGQPVATAEPVAPAAPAEPKKPLIERLPPVIRNNLKLCIIAAGGFVTLLIVLIVILVSLSNNVDMEDYFKVENTGFDKYGSVKYEVDYAGLIDEISDGDYSTDVNDYDSWGDIIDAATSAVDYSSVRGAVDVEVKYPENKENGKLSNGDVVTFIVTFSESVADNLDVDVDELEIEHEVEGLGTAATFNIFENVSLTFEGYDGTGRAVITGESFEKKVGTVTFRYEFGSSYIQCSGEGGAYYPNISFTFDKENEALKNGDKIKLMASEISATSYAEGGVVLESVEKEYTVEGLKASQNYDVLANFEVKFTGVDGDGKAVIVSKESSVTIGTITLTTTEDKSSFRYEDSENGYNSGNIYFSLSENDDLKNGDKVTITADTTADRLADYGVIFTNMTKEVTVSGLGQYAKKAADIKKDSVKTLFEKVKEDLSNRLYDSWGRTVHDSYRDFEGQKIGKDMKLYKTFLTTPKNTTSSAKNTLWLVVSVTLKDDSMDEDTVYYFYYSFSDVAVDSEKNLTLENVDGANKSKGFTDYEKTYDNSINKFNVTVEEVK